MLTVHYYQARGRAEQIRFTLVLGGLQFQNEYPSGYPPSKDDKEKWISLGGNLTTNVPMLVTSDNKVYTQSSALLRVAARMGGLMPDDFEAQYQVDNLIAASDDLRSQAYKACKLFGSTYEVQQDFINNILPLHLKNFERLLGDNQYFVNNQLSVADATIFDAIFCFSLEQVPNCLEFFPKLTQFVDQIKNIPSMKEYLASSQATELMKLTPLI